MFYNLTILLPCFTCLFVFFSLIIKLKNINRSQLVLTILSLFASFFFFVQATYLGGITNIKVYYILDSIDSFVTLTILPLIFIYFRTITSYKPINWTLILLFLPAFIIGCCTAFFYYLMTDNELISVGNYYSIGNEISQDYYSVLSFYKFISIKLYNITLLIQIISLIFYSFYSVVNYHNKLKNYYSNLENKSISINKTILIFINISLIFSCIYIVTKRTFWIDFPNYTMVLFLFWSIPYFIWGKYALTMKYSVEDFSKDLEEHIVKETKDDITLDNVYLENDKLSTLNENLIKVIQEDKPFLKSSLRIDDIANMLCTNRTYISQTIKNNHKCNFSDFINRERIKFAQEYMSNNTELTLEVIAMESGFISASSFYKAFKKHTSCTPKIWLLNKIKENSN